MGGRKEVSERERERKKRGRKKERWETESWSLFRNALFHYEDIIVFPQLQNKEQSDDVFIFNFPRMFYLHICHTLEGGLSLMRKGGAEGEIVMEDRREREEEETERVRERERA